MCGGNFPNYYRQVQKINSPFPVVNIITATDFVPSQLSGVNTTPYVSLHAVMILESVSEGVDYSCRVGSMSQLTLGSCKLFATREKISGVGRDLFIREEIPFVDRHRYSCYLFSFLPKYPESVPGITSSWRGNERRVLISWHPSYM